MLYNTVLDKLYLADNYQLSVITYKNGHFHSRVQSLEPLGGAIPLLPSHGGGVLVPENNVTDDDGKYVIYGHVVSDDGDDHIE